jgi:hypothetical protein
MYISWIELRKQKEEPEHEFVLVALQRTKHAHDICHIERRPLKGANIDSKVFGCKAEDTIAPVDDDDLSDIMKCTVGKVKVEFKSDPRPELYTVFSICDSIGKDPNAKKYTLVQFNCYFFARTITLLLTRHFLLRQFCVHISPRDDLGSLQEAEIDGIVAQVVNIDPSQGTTTVLNRTMKIISVRINNGMLAKVRLLKIQDGNP